MKKLLIIFTFLAFAKAYAQDYAYVRTTFDPNSAFGFQDNPRTENEILGYDGDFEVGARANHIGVYVTYGTFIKQDYQNYAVGVDYYVNWFKGLNMSIGVNYGSVLRKIDRLESDAKWAGGLAVAFRGVTSIKIYKNLQSVATLQYQDRPELGKFILEGALGVEIRF